MKLSLKKSGAGIVAAIIWGSFGLADGLACQGDLPADNPAEVYVVHGDGTVTDRRTGLMWKECAEGLSEPGCSLGSAKTYTWSEALAHAEINEFASYSDWRLPNIKELSSLVESCRYEPTINESAFPKTPSRVGFWSGSPYSPDSSFSWSVEFFTDGGNQHANRSDHRHIRLVRSGREVAEVVRPGESYGGVTFGPHGTISVGSATLFQERLTGISNFDYFYLRVYGQGIRVVELYEVAEDLSTNVDDPLLAVALISAGGDVLEEEIFPGT